MNLDEMQKERAYTNEDESETREIRQFFHRNRTDYVRYRYRDKQGLGGEGWMTKAEFAAWAHHITPYRLPPRARQSSRQKPRIVYFNWND